MSSTKNETKKTQEEQREVSGGAGTELKGQVQDTLHKAASNKKESVYSVDEFCRSAQALFLTRPECVRAALKEKNITKCSRAEAEKIVRAFIKKEVK